MFLSRSENHREDEKRPPDRESPHTDLVVKEKIRTHKPPLYKVFILNDDYTPMEFVVEILESIFNKSHDEAMRIMLHVHRKGSGLCGVYTFDIAETKVAQVAMAARAAQHPLQCIMERE
jgi:ATP-dependent Clp protease adaptor protein ClpS